MKANRYVAKSLENLEMWEYKLNTISAVIDAKLALQRNWIQLESLFHASDIRQ
jgi:hypothetical protein